MKLLISLLTATALTAAPAMAGDWTGGYVGGQVGWSDINGPAARDGDGATYGLHGGYNYDYGDWVLGGELEWTHANITLGSGAGAANADNVLRAKLRLGYDFGDALGYVVAGGSRAFTSVGDDNGVVYGLGVAWAASDQWTVSGEYLHDDYNNFNGLGGDTSANTFSLRVSFQF